MWYGLEVRVSPHTAWMTCKLPTEFGRDQCELNLSFPSHEQRPQQLISPAGAWSEGEWRRAVRSSV